jgi:uncharacterized protein (DUF433 family)
VIQDATMSEDRDYDWRQCPQVASVPGRMSGVPVVAGTRVPVETITDNYDAGMEPAEIADQWCLQLADVNAILEFREKLYAHSAG